MVEVVVVVNAQPRQSKLSYHHNAQVLLSLCTAATIITFHQMLTKLQGMTTSSSDKVKDGLHAIWIEALSSCTWTQSMMGFIQRIQMQLLYAGCEGLVHAR